MRGRRRLLVPGLMTAVMLAMLVGLGVWQLQRLQWKRALLARLDAVEAAAPVSLPADPQPLQKVRAEGRWRPDLMATYGADVRDTRAGPVMGTQVLMPLEMQDGTILVDRGWMPDGAMPPTPAGPVSVTGWLRPSERPGLFTPADAPAKRRFYALDTGAIATALGIAPVRPFVLVALAEGAADGYPVASAHMPRPPNDHFGYALTWFGLALSLLAVFGVYARRMVSSQRRN